jgi:uncharacterized protein YqgV (UPF0045/DUF77 family)
MPVTKMQVAVDISLYPLDPDFVPPIKDVIKRLNSHAGLDITTNAMSTQIFGEYETVMRALHEEIATTFEQLPKAVFTIRILNNPVTRNR